MFPTSLCYILGGIVAITAMLVLYLVVLPRNLDGTFNNKFLQFLHDYFHFKKLYNNEEQQEDAEVEVLYKLFKKNLYLYNNKLQFNQ